ncbi:MAG: PRC-barrel domain-containing protein [Nanoarchaeota archaeon]|nr:PRC-barrel domain-containing protein [Nanoarchaeota archaeon]MBU4300185.1 PRC-barrel domain-containing protein [Nanoarchaeota archaeon]MBU4452059.1 PRC-barrel domain-containing protein [Nanoarchaeota archaeon]MCG2724440.1 PRC-barrel domain-containing protein [archaeon]
MAEIKVRGRELVGKVVVSDEAGKKFGRVGDVSFIADTGELMNLLLIEPTKATQDLHLQQDEQSRHLIPFSAVKSVGDFVIVSEKEIF